MQARKCRSCGAEIIWVTTAKDRPMPLDAKPAFDAGDPVPTQLAGLFVLGSDDKAHALGHGDGGTAAFLGGPIYRSHFVTCPQRDQWSTHPRSEKTGKKA